MIRNIWACCKDTGGMSGLLPVVEKLLTNGYDVLLIASGKSIDLLGQADQVFITPRTTEEILNSYPLPDLFITSMDSPGDDNIGRDLVPLLKGKCPIIALQDFWGARLNTNWAEEKFRPDYICVNDEVGAKIVLKTWSGFPQDHVIISGYPALDKLSDFSLSGQAGIARQKLRLTADLPIVLYGGGVKKSGQALLELVEALNEIGQGIYLIPRLHPRMQGQAPEELPIWNNALSSFKTGHIISDSAACNILSLIALATVITSMYSSVLVEAATLRKQNISILFPEMMECFFEETGNIMAEVPLIELGCSAKATNQTELKRLLEKCLTDDLGLTDNQIKHFQIDGKNAQRIMEFIQNL